MPHTTARAGLRHAPSLSNADIGDQWLRNSSKIHTSADTAYRYRCNNTGLFCILHADKPTSRYKPIINYTDCTNTGQWFLPFYYKLAFEKQN
jgi:hypothetical protein